MTDQVARRPIRRIVNTDGHDVTGQRVDRLSVMHKRNMQGAAIAIAEREAAAHSMEAKEDDFSRDDRAEVVLDEQQLAGVEMMCNEQYGVMTGYAGSGKTTTMKYAIRAVEDSVSRIDWAHYRTVGKVHGNHRSPAIALCCWTNVAARNLASKLDEKWTPHCMSVNAMLAFAPIDLEEDRGNSGMFAPRYTKQNPLPIDIIIIDEAGTIPRDLWEQILDAITPQTRIYMLGDLAQLPAMKGVSPMPFALEKWPHVHLDTIYRQAEGGALIENLNRIRRGIAPVHDAQYFRCGEKERLPSSPTAARHHIGSYISTLYKMGMWDPAQDMILCAENDATLGQNYWNSAFRFVFNPRKTNDAGEWINPPILMKTALGVITLSIGDKVMGKDNSGRAATERRFVNGAIGTITKIEPNPSYSGDMTGLGAQDSIMNSDESDLTAQNMFDFTEDAMEKAEEIYEGQLSAPEDNDVKTRAASHIVTIVEQATGESFTLSRSAEIASLQHAYAATTHRFQGSQARHVLVICHENMAFGLNREHLYTSCSRAKSRVFLMHSNAALNKAIVRQQIVGRNPEEKAEHLRRIYAKRPWGVPNIPNARSLRNDT